VIAMTSLQQQNRASYFSLRTKSLMRRNHELNMVEGTEFNHGRRLFRAGFSRATSLNHNHLPRSSPPKLPN